MQTVFYENQKTKEELLKLPGWEVVKSWPIDVLLENVKFGDNSV